MNDLLNRIERKKATPCTHKCKYFKFPHLKRACVLSDVFSVLQGELCFEYDETDNKQINSDRKTEAAGY